MLFTLIFLLGATVKKKKKKKNRNKSEGPLCKKNVDLLKKKILAFSPIVLPLFIHGHIHAP